MGLNYERKLYRREKMIENRKKIMVEKCMYLYPQEDNYCVKFSQFNYCEGCGVFYHESDV